MKQQQLSPKQSDTRSRGYSDNQHFNEQFNKLERAILDINTRMDRMFKLIEDTLESGKAFRELVQKILLK